MAFIFKQFEVEDRQSTLRVGTDAMLLGSWASPIHATRILDIGTGCGVLALMMAQKSGATIEAIDIDPASVNEARGNFERCPWSDRISAVHETLQHLAAGSMHGYDFIITNPPYFSNLLKSPSQRKNHTRHDLSLTREELVQSVLKILTENGRFALILPAGVAETFIALAGTSGLFLQRRLDVSAKPASPPLRTLMEFGRMDCRPANEPTLSLRDDSGGYMPEYLLLTAEFHYFHPGGHHAGIAGSQAPANPL
ncbi:MAG: methyltransferase [Bacteroidota bacterium]